MKHCAGAFVHMLIEMPEINEVTCLFAICAKYDGYVICCIHAQWSIYKKTLSRTSAAASAGETDRELAVPQFTQNCGAYNIIEF
jgi:hypothetical protein